MSAKEVAYFWLDSVHPTWAVKGSYVGAKLALTVFVHLPLDSSKDESL